jgi:hypothetical protein
MSNWRLAISNWQLAKTFGSDWTLVANSRLEKTSCQFAVVSSQFGNWFG